MKSKCMWANYYGKPLHNGLCSAVEENILALKKENKPFKICVGTDSMVLGNKISYATAVVFVILGNGGFMFVKKSKVQRNMSIKERMISEITLSIEAAYEIQHLIDQYKIKLEIHADINSQPQFASNTSLNEAMGYVHAMGYEFVCKPNAYASSVLADTFTG